MAQSLRLIADVGGTNARFATALTKPPYFANTRSYLCADFENFESALNSYLEAQNLDIANLESICIAAASAVVNDEIHVTNNHWVIRKADLQNKLKIEKVQLINDFTAVAFSLPLLSDSDLICLGLEQSPDFSKDFNFSIIGPGTGCGVGGLLKINGQQSPIVSEGGHVSFAPITKLQCEIANVLAKTFSRVSNEHLLSGSGLVNIYRALCEISQTTFDEEISASEITSQAQRQANDIYSQTLDVFFEVLGQAASDVVLTQGGHDGLFIAGGITQRFPELLVESKFRSAFSNKFPIHVKSALEDTPTWLIMHPDPGLLGAASLSLDLC